jgi:adenylate cyclase
VWRDRIVSDDALTSCIRELRKALADDAKQPRFIGTRHRRGYCFMAPLSDAVARADAQLGLRSPGGPIVAVLPFTDQGGDPKHEYFAEGITEDIISALSRHRSLLVITRTSTFSFRATPLDVRRVSADLGAARCWPARHTTRRWQS